MSKGQYNALPIVPCECGSSEPYWHGNIRREYCCDACWKRRSQVGRKGNGLGVAR